MAWIRKLPSGLWAATVYTRPGDPKSRITETHPYQTTVTNWANNLEADIRRGDFLDPRLAKKTVGDAWTQFAGARRLEDASRRRDASTWKVHVAPKWARTPIGAITKPDVQSWVNELEAADVGEWTIVAAVNVLRSTLELAVDAGWVRANPARRVKTPFAPKSPPRLITFDEQERMLARMNDLFPNRVDGSMFVETMLECGGRWEEVAAVRKEAVDLRRGLVYLGPVVERDGTIREYPKGARDGQSAGFRWVPVDAGLIARLRPVAMAAAPGGRIFTAPAGGSMLYPTWLRRVWNATLRVPLLEESGKPVRDEAGKAVWEPLIAAPLPTPHDCRHTYGTRLGEAGLERHDIMALMGHTDYRSSHRYVHSNEDRRFARAREAMSAVRGEITSVHVRRELGS